MSTPLSLFDIIALATSIFVLLAYHVFFYYSTVQVDGNLQLAFNIRNVSHWLHKHKEKSDPQTTTLAIQTLRNTIMVGIFVGGNALNFAYSVTSSYQPVQSKRMQARSVLLSILLFCSFLCWANVIRHASHLGYLIGTLDFEDKMDLEVLNQLPSNGISNGGSNGTGHLELSQIDTSLTDNEGKDTNGDLEAAMNISDRTKQRVQLYQCDRKIVIKKSEFLLQRMLLYFR